VAACLNNLAGVAYEEGRFSDAEPIFRRALAIRVQHLGSDHPDVAETSNNLAATLCTIGRSEDAVQLYFRAKAIWEKTLGPDHPLVARVHNNLGALWGELGRMEKAESHFLQSLEIRKRSIGLDHPEVARCLANIAIAQSLQGRYTEAEASFHQALDILKKKVDPNHPMEIWMMGKLGSTYRNHGLYEDSERLLTHACETLEAVPGSEGPMLGDCLVELALLRAEQGADANALPLLERALPLLEKGYHPEHDGVLAACNRLARLYTRLGRYQEGEALYRRVLKTIASKYDESSMGPVSKLLETTAWVGIGDLQKRHGEMATARVSWNGALETLGPTSQEARLIELLHIRAITLLHLGRVDEALPLVEQLETAGWRNRDLKELCHESGIQCGELAGRSDASAPIPIRTVLNRRK
jgi:tetratricopeptide (TPR) repeat protein